MRILFIEDDPINRRVMKAMLAVARAEMMEAGDAETGLRMIDEHNFDVVLVDLRMPGMDGLTAIRHIRSRPDSRANVPLLVVTADTGPNIYNDCLAAGANGVLLKPVAMDKLFDAIASSVMKDDQAESIH